MMRKLTRRFYRSVCWTILCLNLLLIVGCGWLYIVGYTLDCQPDQGSGSYCALRDGEGGGRSLQLEESGLSYWRWRGNSPENVRVWHLQWKPHTTSPVILPNEFFEGEAVDLGKKI